MARLVADADALTVRLSRLERLGAVIARDPSVPLSAVRDVRTTADPWRELRGIRAPGTGVPGLIALGTRRTSLGRDFAAVYRRGPGVVVEIQGAAYRRFVVSAADAPAVAAQIERALRPGV